MTATQRAEIAQLVPILKSLDRQEKFYLIQFLVSELAQQEGGELIENASYPIWSPINAFSASDALLKMLNDSPEA